MQGLAARGYNTRVITIYFSAQPRLAQDMAKRFLKSNYPDRGEGNFVSFNMADTLVKDLAKECESLSLFCDKKAILASDCFFLKKGKTKLLSDDNLDSLVEYCKNPNPCVDLIMLYYGSDIDPKNPIVSIVSKTGVVKEVGEPSEEELLGYAQKKCKDAGCPLSQEAARELVDRIDGDYSRLLSELTKLINYANGEEISIKAVRSLVGKKLESDVFAISNSLVKGDVATCFNVYRDLKQAKVEEIALFALLSQQFQFMEKVAYLDERGLSSNQIANELKANRYRVDITLRNLRGISSNELENILEDIYQADASILSGRQEEGFAFERFLANFGN